MQVHEKSMKGVDRFLNKCARILVKIRLPFETVSITVRSIYESNLMDIGGKE